MTNTWKEEGKERTVKGRQVMGALERVMKGRNVSMAVKKGIRNIVILPTLSHNVLPLPHLPYTV